MVTATTGDDKSRKFKISLLSELSINKIKPNKIISTIRVETKSPFAFRNLIIRLFCLFSIKRKTVEMIKKVLLTSNSPIKIISAPKPAIGPMSDIFCFLSKYRTPEIEY